MMKMLRWPVFVGVCMLGLCHSALAAQCSAVFTDGLGSYSGSGSIVFEENSRLLGSDGIIDFPNIDDKTNNDSCESQGCQSSGNSTEALQLPPFQNGSDDITVDEGNTVDLAPGAYDSIDVKEQATLRFSAGDYWIEQLTFEEEASLRVIGGGTVRVYSQQLVIGEDGRINDDLAADRLVLVSYQSIDLKPESQTNALIFAVNKVVVGEEARVEGAINAEEVDVKEDARIIYQPSAPIDAELGPLCQSAQIVDHFRLEHDGQGLTCEAETMTLSACTDNNCTLLFDQPVTITLAPSGWSQGQNVSDAITFIGQTQVQLSRASGGSVLLSSTDSPLRCFIGDTESCEINFVDAGFEFFGASVGLPIPDQTAQRSFINAHLRAVQNNNGVCEAALQGQQDINLSYACLDPGVCATPFQGLDGVNSGGASGSVALNFDANGVASLSEWFFDDVGRLQLSADVTVNGANITSGLANLDIVPLQLRLTHDNTAQLLAGVDVPITISALGANGGVLPNYQSSELQLRAERIIPSGNGVEGDFVFAGSSVQALDNPLGFVAINNPTFRLGQYTDLASHYSEVGDIRIALRDENYLGSTISSNELDLSGYVPAYYAVASSEVTLRDACVSYTYVGQEFAVDLAFNLEARNGQNARVYNHDNGSWNWQAQAAAMNQTTGTDGNYAGGLTYFRDGAFSTSHSQDFSAITRIEAMGVGFHHNRLGLPVVPFNGAIDLSLTADVFTDDLDGHTLCVQQNFGQGCIPVNTPTAVGLNMRYGRLQLRNSFGPETEDQELAIEAQYYVNDATGYVINSDDMCTVVNASQPVGISLTTSQASDNSDLLEDLSNDLVNLTTAGQLLIGGASRAQGGLLVPVLPSNPIGAADVMLNNTGGSDPINRTWADYLYDISQPPAGTVVFGQYRGNDRVIFWREN